METSENWEKVNESVLSDWWKAFGWFDRGIVFTGIVILLLTIGVWFRGESEALHDVVSQAETSVSTVEWLVVPNR